MSVKVNAQFKVIGLDDDSRPVVYDIHTGLVRAFDARELERLVAENNLVPLVLLNTGLINYIENAKHEPVAYFIFRYVDMFGYVIDVGLRGEQVKLLERSKAVNMLGEQ